MATHGENWWPPVGRINGCLRGELHGDRHTARESAKDITCIDLGVEPTVLLCIGPMARD
jgi:hypothetical protein